ncbi:MAG: aminopeptidase [Lachnospiraceae bacterium]|nr:aminopeptidase [Lachnospiraceae bacterium]
MSYKELLRDENEGVAERNQLVTQRLKEILTENAVEEKFKGFFVAAAKKLLCLEELYNKKQEGILDTLSEEELKAMNQSFFEEFYQENYATSYGNPTYAKEKMGDMGVILCHLYYKISGLTCSALMGKLQILTIYEELLVQIYNRFEDKDIEEKELKEIVSSFYHDYVEIFQEIAVREMVNPNWDYYTELIKHADLSDVKYLYHAGLHVTDNEIETAKFINSLPEEDVRAMAFTFTEGFRIGYEKLNVSLKTKKSIEIRYYLGFERMMRYAMENFEKMGLKTTIHAAVVSSTEANRQYNYDHKDDMALYLDKAYVERFLETRKVAFNKEKEYANGFVGPAVLLTFGEKEFIPTANEDSLQLSEKQGKLKVELSGQAQEITTQFILPQERSFTIIAYPIPEIGDKFKEIFAETVKVNTLDYHTYENIQQKMIDVLDQADVVKIKGKGANRTDLTINVCELKNPEKESAFENCVADVNIPVGEVFTSPVLKGTNGVLHVTKVFLQGLIYKDLEIELTDGMITSYNCSNFDKEEDNKKYLMDNLLYHHDTLPIGEFAIGTNTVAYKMGIEYDIQAQLPILIAEKTGPHFAMGDTCYSRSEDVAVFNPDGKEIIARDNEKSILRKEDPSKAYYNCHTDITIPYNELDTIIAVRKDGSSVDLIRDGRFVLEGTEELNIPLDSMK